MKGMSSWASLTKLEPSDKHGSLHKGYLTHRVLAPCPELSVVGEIEVSFTGLPQHDDLQCQVGLE